MVYQDEQVSTSRYPSATPTHVLIVPNRHIASVNDVTAQDEALLGHLFSVARQVAAQEGIEKSGYRLIVNNGPHAGQVVFHLHMHLIGGQRMRHPMG
jgi:histidine triad (HIT) family protein